jgi:1-deoxy-D-xylulose-5-phosphate synthase
MEGLNNAGTLKRQFLVILNDNGMSISKPQGAMAGTSTASASATPTAT